MRIIGDGDRLLCLVLSGGDGEECRLCLDDFGEEYLPLFDGDRESLLRRERAEEGEWRLIRGGLGGLKTLRFLDDDPGERLLDLKFQLQQKEKTILSSIIKIADRIFATLLNLLCFYVINNHTSQSHLFRNNHLVFRDQWKSFFKF